MKTLAVLFSLVIFCGCTEALRLENGRLRVENTELDRQLAYSDRQVKALKLEVKNLRETNAAIGTATAEDKVAPGRAGKVLEAGPVKKSEQSASWKRDGGSAGPVIPGIRQRDLEPITEDRARKELKLLNSAIAGMKEYREQVGNDCWQYAEYHEALLRALGNVKTRQSKFQEIIAPGLASLPEPPTREAQEQLAQRREKQQQMELDYWFKEKTLAQAAQQHAAQIAALDAQMANQKLDHEELMAMERKKEALMKEQASAMRDQKAEMEKQTDIQQRQLNAQREANSINYRISNDLWNLKDTAERTDTLLRWGF